MKKIIKIYLLSILRIPKRAWINFEGYVVFRYVDMNEGGVAINK